jgi:hypothetical protein
MLARRCPVQLCRRRTPQRFICCRDCFAALPTGLRLAILRELDECAAAHVQHTQELLALRDQAIDWLSARNRARFAKPQGIQLTLPTGRK